MLKDRSDDGSHPVSHFAADQVLTAEERADRHGDAFLVLMPGVLSRPADHKATAHIANEGRADIAPAGFRVCLVRPRSREADARISLGRHADNDVVVAHESVSKVHARFKKLPEVYLLQDVGSRNGTLVDDVALVAGGEPRFVPSGSRLRFGSAETLFLRFDEFWRFVARVAQKPSSRR